MEQTITTLVKQKRIVRPLSPDGVADCPQCHSLQSVARHNADWTCQKCAFCERIDDDKLRVLPAGKWRFDSLLQMSYRILESDGGGKVKVSPKIIMDATLLFTHPGARFVFLPNND
jgi:hypothetical protein